MPNIGPTTKYRTNLNAIRSNQVFRIIAVTATILGWLLVSNHCALGLMANAHTLAEEHQCCHNGNGAPKDPIPLGQSGPACCKGLNAVVSGAAEMSHLKPPLTPFLFAVAWVATLQSVETAHTLSFVGCTGPPRVASFSELVLHRSLRSHAPPFLA